MAKAPVIIANVIGQVAAMIVSPFFDGGSVKEKYFDGYRKIADIFPDAALAGCVSEQLGKEVEQKILCEELYLLRSIIYRAENKEQIHDFTGIEYLANLETVRMSYLTDLKHVPPVFQKLPNLKVIEFSHGTLTDIPEWLFKIARLEKLNFSHQEITILSPAVGKAKRLRLLNLSGNKIALLPQEIGRVKHLQILNLSNNPLLRLPNDVSYLTKLNKLDISHTLVADLPINLAFLEDLEYLNIEDTSIEKVDFLLQRRTQDNLRLYESNDVQVRTYSKHEYEDNRRLFPGTMLTATAVSIFAVGFGVNYLKKKKIKKGEFRQ